MPRVYQRHRILRLLHERGAAGITRWDAAREVGCFELSAALIALEAEGVVLLRERESDRNRYGDATRFMRYRLAYAPPTAMQAAYADAHPAVRDDAVTYPWFVVRNEDGEHVARPSSAIGAGA